MKEYIMIICKVCEEEFPRYLKPIKRKGMKCKKINGKIIMAMNRITCCKRCSRLNR